MQEEKINAAHVREQKKRLSQYKRLLKEIKADRLRLAQLSARLVRAAEAGLPDLFGLTPAELENYRARIDENVERCVSLAAGLQQYINAIEDSEVRRLFILRYIYCYSWQRVAFAMGWYDESVPRKKHDRYLAAHPEPVGLPGEVALPELDEALRREARVVE